MAAPSSWSLRGVDPRARDIVRSAAKREGVTIGEWLNRQLLEDDFSGLSSGDESAIVQVLERLSRRIEAADQSVNGVLSRLAGAEQLQTELTGRYSTALGELRETQQTLQARIEQMERAGADGGGLAALRALETTLAGVAEHVRANEAETRAALEALRAEIEQLAARPAKAAEDASRRLDERIAQLERKIAADFSRVSGMIAQEVGSVASRLGRDLAEGARAKIETLETAVAGVTERLEATEKRAKAVNELEGAFAAIEARLRRVEEEIERLGRSGEGDAFAADIEQRLEGLSRELADVAAATRAEIAAERSDLEGHIAAAKRDATASAAKQRRSLARLSAKVSKLAGAVEKRIREVEAAVRASGSLAAETAAEITQLEARLSHVQDDAASTLEAVSRRVGALDARTGELGKEVERRIRDSESRTRALVEDAIAQDRRAPDQAPPMPSPVQLALDALRARLAALETAREAGMPTHAGLDGDEIPLGAPDDLGFDPDPIPEPEPETIAESEVSPTEHCEEDAFSFVYGQAVEDIDEPAQHAEAPAEPIAGERGFDLLQAVRSIAQHVSLGRAGDVGETMAPGFGPVAAPAVKTRKARSLLFAAGGLAVIAVGAAGVTVLREADDASTRSSAGHPLDGLLDAPTPRIAPPPIPALTVAPMVDQEPSAPEIVLPDPPPPLLLTSEEDIGRLQRALATLGYDAGPADGKVGQRTREAARAYQADHGLPPSGVLDVELLEKVEADAAAP